MAFWEGFTQCMVPGPECRVDWEAWSAVAMFATVFVAVWIPICEARRRSKAKRVREEAVRKQIWMSCARTDFFFGYLMNFVGQHRAVQPGAASREGLASIESEFTGLAAELDGLSREASPSLAALTSDLADVIRGLAHDYRRLHPRSPIQLEWDEFTARAHDQLLRALNLCHDIRNGFGPPPSEWQKLRSLSEGRARHAAQTAASRADSNS